ncbi:hypothetical protein BDD12DRAFT_30995 [Trichophaea hybrida]|nr:hypothetical protein BDD12DRAFT_30995 [Trichophaea hybrida]
MDPAARLSTSSDRKVEEAGAITTQQPTKGQRVKAHYKKWWWAHIIVFLILALVAILIAIFAIIPAVAQKLINKTTLTVNSLSIINPTASSFEISMNSTIHGATGAAAHARIEGFKVKLFLDDNGKTPIRSIFEMPVPETHGGGDIPVIQNNVPITIGDMGALDAFAATLMDAYDMRIGMRGRTKIWLGKVSAGVNYNEVVTLKAFNKLDGMVITNYTIYTNNTKGNVGGDVMIPNPTVTTIDMGDVGLKIAYNNTQLGVGLIENLVLRPGNHTYKFMSTIDENQLIPLAVAAGKKASLTIGSNGTSINGVKIPWLSKPLEALDTIVPVNTDYLTGKS